MKNPGAEPAIACTAILMLACLPLLALAQETLRSLSADTPVEVEFINESGGLVEVHWVDYEGNEAAGTPVRSNGTLRINSYATHPFVVRDPETKKRITFFVVGRESKQTFYITPRGGGVSFAQLDPSLPTLTAVEPAQGLPGQELELSLVGSGLLQVARLQAAALGGQELPVLDFENVSDEVLRVRLRLPEEITGQGQEIAFLWAGEASEGWLYSSFRVMVEPPPVTAPGVQEAPGQPPAVSPPSEPEQIGFDRTAPPPPGQRPWWMLIAVLLLIVFGAWVFLRRRSPPVPAKKGLPPQPMFRFESRRSTSAGQRISPGSGLTFDLEIRLKPTLRSSGQPAIRGKEPLVLATTPDSRMGE